MNKYECKLCNTTCRSAYDLRQHFQTPKHLKNEEKEQEDQEKDKDLIIQQRDIEIMKLKAENEAIMKMYKMLLDTINKDIQPKPLVLPLPKNTIEEEPEEPFEGIPFEHATEETKTNVSECNVPFFINEHLEQEQELDIVNLRKTNIDNTNFPLYDLFCELKGSETTEEAHKLFSEYFTEMFNVEDYKEYNKTTTDRIYFGDKDKKWFTCSKSTTLLQELVDSVIIELFAFDKKVFIPLETKYNNEKVASLYARFGCRNVFKISKIIYTLIKDK